MQRAPLTFGLLALAALGAWLAPRVLAPAVSPPPPDDQPRGADTTEGPLRLDVRLDQSAWLAGSGEDRFLVVEVSAPELPSETRRPVNLALVMDSSGSMAEEGKMEAARGAAQALVHQLGPADTLALVTFDDRAWVRIPTTSARDADALATAIDGLSPGGGTNLSDGLERGLAELDRADLRGVRRLVVLSDGMANLGETDPAALTRLASAHVDEGISVSALGVGLAFNEDLLAAMADAGGGRYQFADRPEDLGVLFREELARASRVVGQELSVRLRMAPGVRVVWAPAGVDVAGDGLTAFLGDLHSGETRRIVVKLSAPETNVGALELAEVDLRYRQPEADQPGSAHRSVRARITADAEEAAASRDEKAGVAVGRAITAEALDQGVRAWAEGRADAARQALEAANAQISALSESFDAPELSEQRHALDAEAATLNAAAPETDEGRYAQKKAKETARGYAW